VRTVPPARGPLEGLAEVRLRTGFGGILLMVTEVVPPPDGAQPVSQVARQIPKHARSRSLEDLFLLVRTLVPLIAKESLIHGYHRVASRRNAR
jgi:hypothetical protein